MTPPKSMTRELTPQEWGAEGRCLSGRVGEQMDSKRSSQWLSSAAPWRVWHGRSLSSDSQGNPTLQLSRRETMTLVLLLSLGLWALIWGAVFLLAACGENVTTTDACIGFVRSSLESSCAD
jgi:hypothetical protein